LEQEISDVRAPYWRRAHRDWRFLTVVFVMLACIAIYIMTGDFAWTSHGHAVQLLDTGGNP
jgi:hypothetical protein